MHRHYPRISEVYHNLTHSSKRLRMIAHTLCEYLARYFEVVIRIC